MTVPQLEKRVLDYLTTKGAATKFEIKAAIGCSKSGVQLAVKKLVASGRVETTPRLRKHNSARSHAVYSVVVAKPTAPVFKQPAVESVNVFEHPEIYTRLNGLESNLGRLNRNLTELEKSMATLLQREGSHMDRLDKAVKYLNDLDRDRIRVNDVLEADRARMDGLAERLRALHSQPTVDPAYTAIEQELRPKLEGTFPEDRIRELIDEAYAQRAK
jgi:hypothetical protein